MTRLLIISTSAVILGFGVTCAARADVVFSSDFEDDTVLWVGTAGEGAFRIELPEGGRA